MQNQGIGNWVARRREKSRGDVAVVFRDARITYDEMAERIARLANALANRGVSSGDRVAYLGNNHPSFLETLLATASIGAVFVPVNSRLAAPEIDFVLDDSGATTLVVHADLVDVARAGAWSTDVSRRIVVDGAPTAMAESFEDVLASGATTFRDEMVGIDDAAIILYTSGTTGHPKGAVLSHGNLTWNCFNALVDYGIRHGERVLLISPMFHVASLSMGALPVLLQGGTVILHEKFDPAHVLETIEYERVTMLSGVPTTFQLLQESPNWASADISSLEHLTCGGSAMPERVMAAYEERGLAFAGGYGMTETSPGATAMPQRMSRKKVGSSGLAHFFTDVKIIDESGQTVAPGEVGEILVAGPNVIREYWRRPDATKAAFTDGWFHSGDLGYFDDQGYIYISDRAKDMIISGGENIYSAEVETVIMELPQITGVALIGLPDQKWGEVPMAIVTLAEGATLEQGTLQQHLTGRIAKYKIPKQVVVVEDLPRTASGKVRKADLRRIYSAPQA